MTKIAKENGNTDILIEDRGRAFIINEVVEANEQYITIGSWCPVNIDTVGRFTGMFDKNLREIYEKDILGTKMVC